MSSRLEEFHLEALPDPAVWCPRCSRDRAPSRSASSARGPWPRRRLQTCPDGSRRSRHERPAPGSAPDNDGRPPERCDRRRSECPTAASRHSLSGCRPAAPAEESSSPRTSDSRVCRGCPRGWPQSPQSTVHPLQPLPWLAFTRLKASQTSRFEIENGFASSTGSSRHRLASGQGRTTQPLRSSPITGLSALLRAAPPLSLRIGTFALAVDAACGFSRHAGLRSRRYGRSAGSHVPLESLVEVRAAYTPDAARSVSGHRPSLSRRKGHPAVSTSPNLLSTLLQRFACARLPRPCLPGSLSRRFRNAHHHGS